MRVATLRGPVHCIIPITTAHFSGEVFESTITANPCLAIIFECACRFATGRVALAEHRQTKAGFECHCLVYFRQ